MAGFLLLVLYVTFWLEGWCFSLPQSGPRSVWCGPRVWCTSLPVYRWPPRSSALVQSSQQPWSPSIRDAEAAVYILSYFLIGAGYFITLRKCQFFLSFPFVTFLRLTDRGQVGALKWFPSLYSGAFGRFAAFVDCTKIQLCWTSGFLWFTFFSFRAPGRQPAVCCVLIP